MDQNRQSCFHGGSRLIRRGRRIRREGEERDREAKMASKGKKDG